jgi:beta-lactamase regulating signal transducer with metallopeptidase domain
MNGIIDTILTGGPRYRFVEFLVEVTIKGLFICFVACTITLLMRGFSAYSRKMVWVAALVGLVLLPVLTAYAPVWNMPILPQLEMLKETGRKDANLQAVSGKKMAEEAAIPEVGSASQSDRAGLSWLSEIHWSVYVMIIWGMGAIVTAGWFLLTVIAMKCVTLGASGAGFRLESLTQSVSSGMELKRNFRLKISGRIVTGVTTGVFNPMVILPLSSIGWSDEKLKLVLTHELAHVMRRDGLIELLVNIATILYWFNPLVWLGAGRMRIERERDCDNAVINRGARPSEYASLLMGIAADLQSRARPVLEATMISQGSRLKDRLMCILNPSVNRSTGSSKTAIITGLLVISMIVPLSLSGIWETRADDKKDEKKSQRELTEQERKKLEMKKEQAELEQKDLEMKKEQDGLEQKELEMKKEQDGLEQKELEMKKEQAELERKKLEMRKKRPELEQKELEMKKKKMMKEKSEKMSPAEKVGLSWKNIMEKGGEKSAAVNFGQALKKHGQGKAAKVLTKLKKMKEKGSGEIYFDEKEFNTLGYVLLYGKRIDDAIFVFKNNVDMYPKSWNVYDSLAEGYLVAGKYDKAEKYYKKSMTLNPQNKNGEKMLTKIEKLRKKDTARKGT